MSPSLQKQSTSSTASKRKPRRPAALTSTSLELVTAPSSGHEDAEIHGPFESVWDALEDDLGERERMKVLSYLMMLLTDRVRSAGWTQKEAAKHLGVTQPRISDLMRGKINLFSIDAVVGMLGSAGVRLKIGTRDAA